MTIEEILSLDINPSTFGVGCDTDESDVVDEIYDEIVKIDSSARPVWGCTKMVIFMNEQEVAKLPFHGFYGYDEDDGENYFEDFSTYDYCEVEADIYEQAVEAGVAQFFAKTAYAGRTASGEAVYISERVISYEDVIYGDKKNSNPTPSADSYRKAEESNFCISEDWLAAAFEKFGDELVHRFIQFVKDVEIGDLHTGNIGFRENGEPVLLDYSSYHENM